MAKSQKEISDRYKGHRAYYMIQSSLGRWKLILGLFAIFLGIVWITLFGLGFRRLPWIERFYNVGGISRAHAQIANDCQQCHTVTGHPTRLLPLWSSNQALETGCQHCHAGFGFHEAIAAPATSCVNCHQEHLGTGPMKVVSDTNCQSCHSNQQTMAAARQKVLTIPSRFLEWPRPEGLVYFPAPRMPDGYTQVIHAFDTDHPAFRWESQAMTPATAGEMDRLKFSHKVHLSGKLPKVNGQSLDCNFCHQLDAGRAYMRPITYQNNCQVCHSLQVDPQLPGLLIPHPRETSATTYNFLMTLPTQIEKYAREERHLTDRNQIQAFVGQAMITLRERTRQGDDLVRDVFYAGDYRVGAKTGSRADQASGSYPGCAYCHTVESAAGAVPVIPKPLVPDRWLSHGKFDHSKHSMVNCAQCHGAIRESDRPSQLALPTQVSCVSCHGAKGGATSTCITCHGFHHPAPTGLSTVAQAGTVKSMFIGSR